MSNVRHRPGTVGGRVGRSHRRALGDIVIIIPRRRRPRRVVLGRRSRCPTCGTPIPRRRGARTRHEARRGTRRTRPADRGHLTSATDASFRSSTVASMTVDRRGPTFRGLLRGHRRGRKSPPPFEVHPTLLTRPALTGGTTHVPPKAELVSGPPTQVQYRGVHRPHRVRHRRRLLFAAPGHRRDAASIPFRRSLRSSS